MSLTDRHFKTLRGGRAVVGTAACFWWQEWRAVNRIAAAIRTKIDPFSESSSHENRANFAPSFGRRSFCRCTKTLKYESANSSVFRCEHSRVIAPRSRQVSGGGLFGGGPKTGRTNQQVAIHPANSFVIAHGSQSLSSRGYRR